MDDRGLILGRNRGLNLPVESGLALKSSYPGVPEVVRPERESAHFVEDEGSKLLRNVDSIYKTRRYNIP